MTGIAKWRRNHHGMGGIVILASHSNGTCGTDCLMGVCPASLMRGCRGDWLWTQRVHNAKTMGWRQTGSCVFA